MEKVSVGSFLLISFHTSNGFLTFYHNVCKSREEKGESSLLCTMMVVGCGLREKGLLRYKMKGSEALGQQRPKKDERKK